MKLRHTWIAILIQNWVCDVKAGSDSWFALGKPLIASRQSGSYGQLLIHACDDSLRAKPRNGQRGFSNHAPFT